jgi:hypothetical protein
MNNKKKDGVNVLKLWAGYGAFFVSAGNCEFEAQGYFV